MYTLKLNTVHEYTWLPGAALQFKTILNQEYAQQSVPYLHKNLELSEVGSGR